MSPVLDSGRQRAAPVAEFRGDSKNSKRINRGTDFRAVWKTFLNLPTRKKIDQTEDCSELGLFLIGVNSYYWQLSDCLNFSRMLRSVCVWYVYNSCRWLTRHGLSACASAFRVHNVTSAQLQHMSLEVMLNRKCDFLTNARRWFDIILLTVYALLLLSSLAVTCDVVMCSSADLYIGWLKPVLLIKMVFARGAACDRYCTTKPIGIVNFGAFLN